MRKKNQDISFTVLIPPDKYQELKSAAAMDGNMSLAAFMRKASYEAAKNLQRQQYQQAA